MVRVRVEVNVRVKVAPLRDQCRLHEFVEDLARQTLAAVQEADHRTYEIFQH